MVHPIPGSGIAQTYLITDEKDSLMVVDCGSVGAAWAVEDFCAHTIKRSLMAIRIIAASHFHFDHIGGIAALLSKCSSKTMVLFHPLVKAYLEAGRPLSPMRNWFTGLFPALVAGGFFGVRKLSDLTFDGAAGVPLHFFRDQQRVSYEERIRYIDDLQAPGPCGNWDRFDGCKPRHRSDLPGKGASGKGEQVKGVKGAPIGDLEGNRLPRSRIGFGGWEVFAAPGHTEESVVFYNEASGELIAGDLILGRKNGRGYVNRFCWDEEQTRRTFAALAQSLHVRIIFPGHGPVVWSAEDAFRKVDGFAGAAW